MNEQSAVDDPGARIAELNLLFLVLAGAVATADAGAGRPVFGLPWRDARRIAALEAAMRQRVAASPVALFRMPLACPPVGDGLDPAPWLPPGRASMQQAFVLTALACQWHMVRSHADWAAVGFGLDPAAQALLRETPLSRLPGLASAATDGLSARFTGACDFWPRVLSLAARRRLGDLALANVAALHIASAERVGSAAPGPWRVSDSAMALQWCDSA